MLTQSWATLIQWRQVSWTFKLLSFLYSYTSWSFSELNLIKNKIPLLGLDIVECRSSNYQRSIWNTNQHLLFSAELSLIVVRNRGKVRMSAMVERKGCSKVRKKYLRDANFVRISAPVLSAPSSNISELSLIIWGKLYFYPPPRQTF